MGSRRALVSARRVGPLAVGQVARGATWRPRGAASVGRDQQLLHHFALSDGEPHHPTRRARSAGGQRVQAAVRRVRALKIGS
eukprot:4345174-Pyramimonas_sp.AAC.3